MNQGNRPRRFLADRRVLTLFLGTLAACGSGGGSTGASQDSDVLDTADVPVDALPVETANPCPSGQVEAPAGGCMPVGIQGCAAMFIEDDGLCHPRMDKCPKGTIPKFDEGCVPVGIQGCAALFMEDDGLCHPSVDKCPKGTIPKFDEGCVPVGIQGCAALFMEADGLCHPRMDKCPKGTIPKFDEGCVPVGIQGCAAVFMEDDGYCHPRTDKCPKDTFPVPSRGCVPIDGEQGCGTGTWGDIADGPDTFYVDPSVPDDSGDGTKAAPARTIAAVLDKVPAGGRIALAAGDYPEAVVITKAIEIVGRCPSMVRLSGTAGSATGLAVTVLVSQTNGVAIRRIGIGGDGIGIANDGPSSVLIDGVLVSLARRSGFRITGVGSAIEIRNSFVSGTRSDTDGSKGFALSVGKGAYAKISQSALVDSHSVGIISINTGSVADVTDCLIEGTQVEAGDGSGGYGLLVQDSGRMDVSSSAVVRNRAAGAVADMSQSEMYLEDSLIADNQVILGVGNALAPGIICNLGARVTVQTSLVTANEFAGVVASGVDSKVTAMSSLFRGNLPAAGKDGQGGSGLILNEGSITTLTNSAVVANRSAGILGYSCSVEAEGNLVEDTLPVVQETQTVAGHGFLLSSPVNSRIEGNAVVGNRLGIEADGSNGARILSNLIDTSGESLEAAPGQFGVLIWDGTAEIRGNSIRTGTGNGVITSGSKASVTLSQNLVSWADQGSEGGRTGVLVIKGAQAFSSDDSFVSASNVGMRATGAGSRLEADRCLVQGTRSRTEDDMGIGVLASREASAVLRGCEITGCSDSALFALGNASLNVDSSMLEKTIRNEGASSLGGLGATDGSTVVARRCAMLANNGPGLFADSASLSAEASLIAFNQSVGSGLGVGVWVEHDTHCSLAGNAVFQNEGVGVLLAGTGSQIMMLSNLVEGTLPSAESQDIGLGLQVKAGGELILEGDAVINNRLIGISLHDDNLQGTRFAGRHILVEGTLPRDSDKLFGVGIASSGSKVELASSLIERNRMAGLVSWRGTVDVTGCVIQATQMGLGLDSKGDSLELGDGVLALIDSKVDIISSEVSSNARAGILLDRASGSIAGNRCNQNRYGLAVSQSPSLTLGQDNNLDGNSEQSLLTDGTLPVANAPIAVPSFTTPHFPTQDSQLSPVEPGI